MLSHLLPGAAYLHCIPGWFSQQSPWVRVWRCFTVEGNSLNAFPLTTEKVHAEIERVLGPDCPPTFEDRKNMPFTNAVIHEVQRFVTLLPHVPRCTSADTRFKGYFIPKVRAALQPMSGWWHTGQNATGRFGAWASAQNSVTAQNGLVVG